LKDRRTAAVAILVLALLLNEWALPFLTYGFVRPSGFLAGWLVGVSPFLTESGVSFVTSSVRLDVTPACCGFVFFGLVMALGTLVSPSVKRLLLATPLVFLFVIGCNALRIVFWAALFPSLERVFPSAFLNAGHELAGAIVYLPAAFLAHYLLRRFIGNSPLQELIPTHTELTPTTSQQTESRP